MRVGRVGALCVGILPVLALALTGCAPWIAANPQFASDSASNPGAAPTTAEAGGPPEILAPRNDLTWKNCTPELFGDAGTQPIPGVVLECADYASYQLAPHLEGIHDTEGVTLHLEPLDAVESLRQHEAVERDQRADAEEREGEQAERRLPAEG